jgi:hypothetical protein
LTQVLLHSETNPDETTATERTQKKASAKVSFTIDFLDGEDVSADDIFSNKRGASITLGHTKDHLTYLLPDDEHFSSKQLLRYFMKPIFSVSTLRLFLCELVLTFSDRMLGDQMEKQQQQ